MTRESLSYPPTSLGQRHSRVPDSLDRDYRVADPRIRAIAERALQSSSANRRARKARKAQKAHKAMKTTSDEIAARRKCIDAKLRKQAREGAPERPY